MTSRRACMAGLVGVALAARPAVAQLPAGLPAGVGLPTPAAASSLLGAGTGVGATPLAAPKTLWGFFGLSKGNLAACKAKLCGSQFGQMANSLVTGPMAGISGGFIPALCPPALSTAAIAALPGGPAGAEAVAAKIKQSEVDAKARVAAVEYLGTVDCTHWPEATAALMNALREDPNECVRLAAARVLNSGCCCSKDIINALKNSVSGEGKDGAPPETSARVKAAAFSALQNCLMRVPEDLPPEVPPEIKLEKEEGQVPALAPIEPLIREKPTGPTSTSPTLPTHTTVAHLVPIPRERSLPGQARTKTFAETVNEARHTLFIAAQKPVTNPVLPPGKQSVLDALIKARQDLNTQGRTPPPTPPYPNVPTDAGVRRSSYTPTPSPSTIAETPAQKLNPAKGTEATGPTASTSPSASTSKGLLGLLGNSLRRRGDE